MMMSKQSTHYHKVTARQKNSLISKQNLQLSIWNYCNSVRFKVF